MSKTDVYHDVTTGESVEVQNGDETYRRMIAARRLGCDESDLRRGYDHSGRQPDDWREDLDDEDLEVLDGLEQDGREGVE